MSITTPEYPDRPIERCRYRHYKRTADGEIVGYEDITLARVRLLDGERYVPILGEDEAKAT